MMSEKLTELEKNGSVLEDEGFMELVSEAQAEPNRGLPLVMEGLKFLLMKLRRQYGWGLEEDVELQLEQIGVYRALKLWHGKDRRQFAALAAWQVRGVLWNEVRRERDFRDHRCSECEGDGCEPGLEQAVVNDFYQQDERRTRILAVRVLLARLPKMQAIVVRALYLEGKEPRDVTLEQHINVSSVYRRRDRGIANLHKLLTGGRRLA